MQLPTDNFEMSQYIKVNNQLQDREPIKKEECNDDNISLFQDSMANDPSVIHESSNIENVEKKDAEFKIIQLVDNEVNKMENISVDVNHPETGPVDQIMTSLNHIDTMQQQSECIQNPSIVNTTLINPTGLLMIAQPHPLKEINVLTPSHAGTVNTNNDNANKKIPELSESEPKKIVLSEGVKSLYVEDKCAILGDVEDSASNISNKSKHVAPQITVVNPSYHFQLATTSNQPTLKNLLEQKGEHCGNQVITANVKSPVQRFKTSIVQTEIKPKVQLIVKQEPNIVEFQSLEKVDNEYTIVSNLDYVPTSTSQGSLSSNYNNTGTKSTVNTVLSSSSANSLLRKNLKLEPGHQTESRYEVIGEPSTPQLTQLVDHQIPFIQIHSPNTLVYQLQQQDPQQLQIQQARILQQQHKQQPQNQQPRLQPKQQQQQHNHSFLIQQQDLNRKKNKTQSIQSQQQTAQQILQQNHIAMIQHRVHQLQVEQQREVMIQKEKHAIDALLSLDKVSSQSGQSVNSDNTLVPEKKSIKGYLRIYLVYRH